MPTLQRFTDPRVLYQIGRRAIGRLMQHFAAELKARHIQPDPLNGYYFFGLAELFGDADRCPAPMLKALREIEELAAPENRQRLDGALARLWQEVESDNSLPREHDALQLWLFDATHPPSNHQPPPAPAPGSAGIPAGEVQPGAPCAAPPSAPPTPHSQNAPGGRRALPGAAGPQPSTLSPQPSVSHHSAPITPPSTIRTPAAIVLDALVAELKRFVVLPQWVAETLALWIVHTFAWELRDVSTYLGIESPMHRCGKSTLMAVLQKLVNRPEVAAHISSPAFFHTIQNRRPTLLVDETDKVLKKNHLLCGILNASYVKDLAYVVRVVPRSRKHGSNGKRLETEYIPLTDPDAEPSTLDPQLSTSRELSTLNSQLSTVSDVARYCCWCPKVMAQIGRFPETLADRCIIIRMQRKTPAEKCERVRRLDGADLRRQCAEFVRDHREAIANAEPAIPDSLNDRAADIWTPLLVLADLAGGEWPDKARQAAMALSGSEPTTNVMSGLLLDCLGILAQLKVDRIFTRDLVMALNALADRPWRGLTRGKPINEYWLARQLRPFGILPQTLWVGAESAKGYLQEAFVEPARRYVSKADWEAYQAGMEGP